MLIIHEQKCQELCQANEQMGERQELLATVMKRKRLCKMKLLKNSTSRSSENSGVGGTAVQRRIGSAKQEAQFGKNEKRKGACQNGRRESEA